MKRLLAFLLLFAAGVALVWWLGSGPERVRDEPEAPAPIAGQFTDVQVPGEGGERRPIGVVFDGALSFTQFFPQRAPGEVQRPRLTFRASDLDAVAGEAYDAHHLLIETFDETDGARRARLTSPLSRLALALEAGEVRLGQQGRARLTNVEVLLERGVPVVPLTLSVPTLDWERATQRFSSPDRVQIRGQGLEAEGTGLDVDTLAESFALERHGRIRLDLQDGSELAREATLEATRDGTIRVRRMLVEGIEHVDVEARDGARLSFSGQEPVAIDADRIHFAGRAVRSARSGFEVTKADAQGQVVATSRGDTFRAQEALFRFVADGRLEELRLDGDVVLESGADSFTSQNATFRFDAAGDLERAELSGEPRGLVQVGRLLPGERADVRAARAEISGAGPLVITRGEGVLVDLAGPGRVDVREFGLSLAAQERLAGRVAADQSAGALEARGASELRYGASRVRSAALVLDWTIDAQGQLEASGWSRGETRAEFELPGRPPGELVARQGLEMRLVGERLVLPVARGIGLKLTGEGGFEARAREVRDFDPHTRTFVAEGDVAYQDALGAGWAARAEALPGGEFVLDGAPGRPASYEFAGEIERVSERLPGALSAQAQAQRIRSLPDRLEARGEVVAHVAAGAQRLDFESDELDLVLDPQDPAQPAALRNFRGDARGGVRAQLQRTAAGGPQGAEQQGEVRAESLQVRGTVTAAAGAQTQEQVGIERLEADGDVHAEWGPAGGFSGRGDHFVVDGQGHGRLWADEERRIEARGRLPGDEQCYELSAAWVEFEPERIVGSQVQVLLDHPPFAPQDPEQPSDVRPAALSELRAERLEADRQQLLLEGTARVAGETLQGEPWELEAGTIHLRGDLERQDAGAKGRIDSLLATGGFRGRFGAQMSASGERLDGQREEIRVEGQPARLTFLDAEWESAWVQLDMANMLLATDKGLVRSSSTSTSTSWSLTYESMQPFDQGQSTILVLRNPRLRFGSLEMRADWTLFWVDRAEWQRSGRRMISESVLGAELRVREPGQGPGEQPPRGGDWLQNRLEELRRHPVFRVLSEVYVEGNVEFYQQADRVARGTAVYLDLIEGHGWIEDADVTIDVPVRGQAQRLRAKAEWMRISPGPSLRADKAVITSCDYDDPHYVIETGDLRLTPGKAKQDERVAFDVAARNNALRFQDGFSLPLPPVVFETDREGNPLIDRFVLGDSARFGASIQASINAELGSIGLGVGRIFGWALALPDVDFKGGWKYRAGFLGSRGFLFGAGLHLESDERFKFDLDVDGIPDRRSDRGLIRVDRDDRSLVRAWLRSRARYTVSETEWFDLVVSRQTDAGVQSEFFESDYLSYEQKDTYLHWRKASGSDYLHASAKVRIEDRVDTDELPALGAFRGRQPLGEVFGRPLLYDAFADAAFLRRREGDGRYFAPFADGLGDRDVLRADTGHRLELPLPLGFAAARATPYVALRGSFWDRGADDSQDAHRAALLAGIETAAVFWRRYPKGGMHTITPTLGLRGHVLSEEDGEPVTFDQVEAPLDGVFIDVGLRNRWWIPETREQFDLDLRTSYGADLPGEEHDGFQPFAALGEYLTFWGETPVGLTHDGHYDTNSGDTVYSRSFLGFEPWRNVGVELGYHRGRDDAGDRLYEAASLATRWRWTTKWEFEFEQTQSLSDNRRLSSSITLRRLGHDFVLETELGYRAGEGASLSVNVLPMLTWRRSGLGLLDRWLGLYH